MKYTQSIIIARVILLLFVLWIIFHASMAQRWGIMIAGALSVYHLIPWQFWEWLTKENYKDTDNQRFLVGIGIFTITFLLYYTKILA